MTPKLSALIEHNPRVMAAYYFATAAHAAVGQVRKYTGDPYIVHPVEVAGIVASTGATVDEIVAALLHDVLEDTGVNVLTIIRLFGTRVARIVVELTDQYTPDFYPDMTRRSRKLEEANRYAWVSLSAKTIKLADGLSNTPSIAEHDPGFLKTYGPEKRRLLSSLRGGDAGLWTRMDGVLLGLGY